jgi:hypothetical protein
VKKSGTYGLSAQRDGLRLHGSGGEAGAFQRAVGELRAVAFFLLVAVLSLWAAIGVYGDSRFLGQKRVRLGACNRHQGHRERDQDNECRPNDCHAFESSFCSQQGSSHSTVIVMPGTRKVLSGAG